ncbi:MAG TPA: TauD/TfdA family dioxygenase [Longimicrobiaceae bacterium]|nr:TauD/TfdA family dioxygenase [Longimicrobiaceae bacterium]
MSTTDQSRTGAPAFRAGPRRTIGGAQESLIREDLLRPGQELPLVIRPAVAGLDPLAWASGNRELIEGRLRKHGAILFRGFPIPTVETFHAFVEAAVGELMEYRERSSPRHEEGERVYTSTDYPADQRIFLHNEHSYARRFPLKLFFFCLTPAEEGGQTPIADTRRIFQRVDPAIRDRFAEKGWRYVRNFGDGFGLPWQTVFQTSDPREVEEYCARNGIECEWKPGNRLRTWQTRPAIAVHPRTGEETWFNHATFFHVTTLPREMREALLADFAEGDLPNNTYYGDGSPIEPETMEALRAAYQAETVMFDWEAGDVLLVDNMLASHARESFRGPRRVLVAMADPYERTDL